MSASPSRQYGQYWASRAQLALHLSLSLFGDCFLFTLLPPLSHQRKRRLGKSETSYPSCHGIGAFSYRAWLGCSSRGPLPRCPRVSLSRQHACRALVCRSNRVSSDNAPRGRGNGYLDGSNFVEFAAWFRGVLIHLLKGGKHGFQETHHYTRHLARRSWFGSTTYTTYTLDSSWLQKGWETSGAIPDGKAYKTQRKGNQGFSSRMDGSKRIYTVRSYRIWGIWVSRSLLLCFLYSGVATDTTIMGNHNLCRARHTGLRVGQPMVDFLSLLSLDAMIPLAIFSLS